MTDIHIYPVANSRDEADFIELPYRLYADDPHWVPPLRSDMRELLNRKKNPFFDHARMQLYLAREHGSVVGRISAHIDELALAQPAQQGMGPGTGNFGMFEASNQSVGDALMAEAEQWLRAEGMTRVLGPLSLSVWDEPGLLTKGHDHSPTVMMGHHKAAYERWIEAAGYKPAKQLSTWDLNICQDFPPLINRIIQSGERNSRITVRKVDKAKFGEEAAIILSILNDAWSDNWGFVPLTDREIAYAGKKLKPIVREDLIRIAELEGRPVAFMMTLPDLNEPLKSLNGSLWPFGWAKLLLWLRNPRVRTMRVPLMGVLKEHQGSRLASQLAFMMIEYIRRASVAHYGATRGEIGWILDDNEGMIAIADALDSQINRCYTLFEKPL
jgi:GNAT superfamily N-acetyltransferase